MGFTNGDVGGCACCGSSGFPCGACNIPQTNLTLTWILVGGICTTTCTLIYNATGPTWTATNCFDSCNFGTGGTFLFLCISNVPCLKVTGAGGPGSFCDNCGSPPFSGMTLTSYTCSPLNIQYSVSGASACGGALFSGTSATFTITP